MPQPKPFSSVNPTLPGFQPSLKRLSSEAHSLADQAILDLMLPEIPGKYGFKKGHRQTRSGNGEKTVKQLITLLMLRGPSLTGGLSFAAAPRGRFFFTPAPGEKTAATASTPEQKVLEAQPESALERLRRTRPEGNGNAPDRR